MALAYVCAVSLAHAGSMHTIQTCSVALMRTHPVDMQTCKFCGGSTTCAYCGHSVCTYYYHRIRTWTMATEEACTIYTELACIEAECLGSRSVEISRTLTVVISVRTSSKNRPSTPISTNGGSSKCGDAETGLEDANRLPTPPQPRSKTTQEAPQKVAQTTAEDAKSVTA